MVKVKVYNYKRDHFVEVEVVNAPEEEYGNIRQFFLDTLKSKKPYEAIADAFVFAIKRCPEANPSDIWQHFIYRTYIEAGNNEQSWKRASGQGFEVAFANIYNPQLAPYGIRIVVLSKVTAIRALREMGLTGKIEPSKMDIAIEGLCNTKTDTWKIFGAAHGKTSLAERIKDDAPASRVIMDHDFVSVAVTLDSKSFPPPHGDGVNHGELGGRTIGAGLKENQPKRNYFERDGDFHHGYSYNLRTPPSADQTPSGSRIKTLSFSGKQPDDFVKDMIAFWNERKEKICAKMPPTKIQ